MTALPSIGDERWVALVQETDVLLVSGGDALYLRHWMRESGLADLLPSLDKTVWVGLSAGSMVMTPRIGEDFVGELLSGGDSALGVVDFSIFPHLDNEDLPQNTMAGAERWAAGLSGPGVTRSTTRPPSRWSKATSRSFPRGTGNCSDPGTETGSSARVRSSAPGSSSLRPRLRQCHDASTAPERSGDDGGGSQLPPR